jgi:hypothetical protein
MAASFFTRMRERREKNKKYVHVISGVMTLFHAYERFDGGHSTWVYFLVAGLVFMSIAFFHEKLEHRYPWIDGVFLVIEASLSLVIAYEFFHMGKKALPYTYLFVAAFQLFMAFYRSKKAIAKHKGSISQRITE